jgi:hypothetical protein
MGSVPDGLLYLDSPKPRIAETLVVPDVQVRFGPASRGWFELGMGAYNASTMLGPGVYVGGGVVLGDFTIVARYGWHFAIGSFGHTIVQFGGRADVGAMVALLPNLHLGGGAVLQNSRGFAPAFGSSRCPAAARRARCYSRAPAQSYDTGRQICGGVQSASLGQFP